MHVLITGGAGFIGSHLVELHLTRGDHVHVVDDLSTGSRDNLAPFLSHPRLCFEVANVLTWNALDRASAWADRIYHLAAVVGVKRVLAEPVSVLAINIAGTERLLRAVHAGGWRPQIVLASSSEVYGRNPSPRFEEHMDLVFHYQRSTRWNYAISKLADESLGLSYHRRHGHKIVVARLFNTIGPRQTGRYGMVVPTFIAQAVAGQPLTVYGDGRQTRSFCDVRDVVAMLDQLAGTPAAYGDIVNVGNDREISIAALAELVRAIAGSASALTYMSYVDAYGEDFEDTRRRRPALGRLHGLIDYRPRWSLEETLAELVQRACAGGR
jgi:UDP-glucose 4-epimerase